ncbi:MAG: hypothetical protein CVT61_15995 [Actinobacteria bacterium HGW-Actinobacteria-11]|nr:MAG: hypothetical protein CVT61_15995 [Actinobacteria bacterium HGW-Actinobacteria-11]
MRLGCSHSSSAAASRRPRVQALSARDAPVHSPHRVVRRGDAGAADVPRDCRCQGILASKDQQVAELAPRAGARDELASAEGDYSVADAAKILALAGVKTGPRRLFDQLAGMRWIRRAHDGKWRAYVSTVDNGYLT